MKIIQVRIPETDIEKLESKKEFKSISQAIRKAVEEFNRKSETEKLLGKISDLEDEIADMKSEIRDLSKAISEARGY